MSGQKRQANFELLRIVAMFMVVVMHYLSRTIAWRGTIPGSGLGSAYVVLESFCIVAVNAYVLLSGYFLSAAAFRWKRVFRLIAQMLFYTVLIPLVLAALGVISFFDVTNLYHVWGSIFPVQTGQYWFVTAYIVLMLFVPALNMALQKLEKKQFLQMLSALLLFFCIGKTLSPLQFATDKFGYDFGWFMVLYLIGGYIRRFGAGFMKSAARGWLLYIGSCIVIAGIEFVLVFLKDRYGLFDYYLSVPYHYNFLFGLTGALGLFFAFYHMNIKEGPAAEAIRFVSPAVLGVYLIHEQADVRLRWFDWVNTLTGKWSGGVVMQRMEEGVVVTSVPLYLAVMALQTLLVFAVCILIDRMRMLVFDGIGRLFQKKRPDR